MPVQAPLHFLRNGLFLGALAATPMFCATAQAEPANIDDVRQYDIAAGQLDQALNQFARTAGVLLSVDAQLTTGKSTPGLHGQFNIPGALQRLLAGSGLQAVNSGNAWSLQLAPDSATLQLDATLIGARNIGENPWGPVDGIVATRSATGSKTDSALVEVPQTINVVTADEIKARGAQTVTQALRYTPGITGGGFSDRVKIFDEPTSRGITPVPLYLDGLHLPYGGGSTGGALQIEPYSLERIEVLKGPASVLYGQNQPGGIVNMVSKRPTLEPVHEVVLKAGSYDQMGVGVDVGGPLDEQGTLLYRLTGLVNDSNSSIDYAQQKRQFLAPSLTWLPNEDTSLTLFAQYQRDDAVPEAQGLPALGTVFNNPNGRISRDLFLGEPGVNDYKRNQYALGYELSHRLNDVWTLKQNARYAVVDDHYTAPLHGYRFVNNPVTGADDKRYMTRYGVDWSQTNKVFGVDNIAQAEFDSGPLKHTLITGLDYYRFNSKFKGLYDYNPPIIDIFNPVHGQPLNFGNLYRWDNTITQTGLYMQDQIKLDQWVLVLGGRYDWTEVDNKEPVSGAHSNVRDSAFTGRAGLVYLFDNGLAPFISYAESFQPVSGRDVSGKPFEATTGKQYEIGLKFQPPGQQSFVQLSVYQLDQENMLTTDLDNPGFNGQTGAVRSTGVELEGKASLNKSLDIIASVSRNDIEYTKDNDGRQGNHLAGSSPLTASAWVNYTFLGDTPLGGFGAGLGVRYVRSSPGTEYPGTATAPSFDVPSFTVYDARLSYDLGQSPLGLKGVKVDMNVENLDDKKYVANCTSNWDCYYGDGRTMTTSLTYNW